MSLLRRPSDLYHSRLRATLTTYTSYRDLNLHVWEGTLISTEEKFELVKSQADEDAFKAEFAKALADLMSKVRYRGIAHYEWIADQFAHSLMEDPALQRQLVERLPKFDQQERETA